MAFLMGKRFNVVPLGNIKSHLVTIDSGVLYGIMKEISPAFDLRRGGVLRRNPPDVLEEYLRFQTSESEQAKVVQRDD